MADQPIIIKRVKRGGHGEHHGGSWKLAYADFVTAMMAFFLLLWLLNSVTEEQLLGIADYFAPPTTSASSSGAGGMLGGTTIGQGAETSNSSPPSFTLSLPPPTIGSGGDATTDPGTGSTKDSDNNQQAGDKDGPGGTTGTNPNATGGSAGRTGTQSQQGAANSPQTAAEAARQAAAREEQQFQQAQAQLRQAINSIPDLAKLANSLMVDDTPEGLRIQIVDQDGLAMFPLGSANMFGSTRALLTLVGRVVNQLPERISIAGNTDSTPYTSRGANYTNWELSSDRAQAARRVLADAGVAMDRVERVEGMADSDPLIKDNPADPRNRRISITLLRQNQVVPTDVRVGSDQFSGGQIPAVLGPGGAPAPAASAPAGSASPAPAAAPAPAGIPPASLPQPAAAAGAQPPSPGG